MSVETHTAPVKQNQEFDDYLAWLNFQGERGVWKSNRRKLNYVFKKVRGYFRPSLRSCDIGLGEGYTLEKMYEFGLKPTGIDIAQYSIGYLKKRFSEKEMDIRLIHGDISKVELEENQFDIVTCFDVLEHVPGDNLRQGLDGIRKSLVNGGLLIGTLPYKENLDESRVICPECGHRFHRYGHFHSFQDMNDIARMLQPGFEILESGEVPYSWFESPLLNLLGTKVFKFLKNMARSKYRTTIYFIARLAKI
jgi:SAM-dependent methyltransferase